MPRTRPSRPERFRDRTDAGRALAERLTRYRGGEALVIGLARGGVPVAAEVARRLMLPLEVVVVRKVGLPQQPELAVGAVADYGSRIVNGEVVARAGLPPPEVDRLVERAAVEVDRLGRRYRGERPLIDPAGRTAILVDDGLATGASMRAAIGALRTAGASSTIVAVPVAPRSAAREMQGEADEFICLLTPEPFLAVSPSYEDFTQTTDEEIRGLLASSSRSLRLDPRPPE